jgi:hypothetical protein
MVFSQIEKDDDNSNIHLVEPEKVALPIDTDSEINTQQSTDDLNDQFYFSQSTQDEDEYERQVKFFKKINEYSGLSYQNVSSIYCIVSNVFPLYCIE